MRCLAKQPWEIMLNHEKTVDAMREDDGSACAHLFVMVKMPIEKPPTDEPPQSVIVMSAKDAHGANSRHYLGTPLAHGGQGNAYRYVQFKFDIGEIDISEVCFSIYSVSVHPDNGAPCLRCEKEVGGVLINLRSSVSLSSPLSGGTVNAGAPTAVVKLTSPDTSVSSATFTANGGTQYNMTSQVPAGKYITCYFNSLSTSTNPYSLVVNGNGGGSASASNITAQ